MLVLGFFGQDTLCTTYFSRYSHFRPVPPTSVGIFISDLYHRLQSDQFFNLIYTTSKLVCSSNHVRRPFKFFFANQFYLSIYYFKIGLQFKSRQTFRQTAV
jgi:hypothetical protein